MRLVRHLGALGGLGMAALLGGGAALPPAAQPYSRMDLPWWKARFAEKQAELRAGPVGLLWLGDSITQQFETAGPQPWANFTPVWQRFYAPRHAVNLGFKGDATAHLLWRIEHGETEGIHPRLAIILIGANNFGHLHWDAASTLIGIETVVAAVHRRLPDTRILLLGVLPSIRSAWVDANTQAVNRGLALRYAGGRDAVFQDLTALFLAPRSARIDRGAFLDSYLMPPEPPLHPTAQIQERMAEAIEPEVSRMTGDRDRSRPR